MRADGTGAPAVTDGPFPESKEFLIGFWVVDVDEPRAGVRDRRQGVGRARAGAASRSASRSRCGPIGAPPPVDA